MLEFVLRYMKCFGNCKTNILYNSLVRSIFEYCSVVWRPYYAAHSVRLESIQKIFIWQFMYSYGISKKIFSSCQRRFSHFQPTFKKEEVLNSAVFFLCVYVR